MDAKKTIFQDTLERMQGEMNEANQIVRDISSGHITDSLVVVNFSGMPFKVKVEHSRLQDAHVSPVSSCTRFPLTSRRPEQIAHLVKDGAKRPSRVMRLSEVAKAETESLAKAITTLLDNAPK